jgi:uncharacterized protein YraI
MIRPNRYLTAAAVLLASSVAASAAPVVLETNLNLRQAPGPQHRVIAVMPAGARVIIGGCNGEWCRIDYRGQRGYASSAHITGNGAFAAAPPPPPPAAPPPIATKYDADDAVRVLQWRNSEWRDRYWREMEVSRTRR